MASDEPTDGNIQHTAPAEHNTGAVPGTTVVDVDGAAIVDAGVPRLSMLMMPWLPTRTPCPLLLAIIGDPCHLSQGAWRHGLTIPLHGMCIKRRPI